MSQDVLESGLFERAPDDPIRVLDSDGEVVSAALEPDLDVETLLWMYRDMRFSRRFDERMISLQRQGRLGTYASLAGQEGSQIGSTYALADDDLLSYQYREHGAVIARELPWEYLLYWMGHEDGNAALAELDVFPLNISIGGHLPHAVGWSWAAKRNDDERVSVVHFGDGSTSEGDFHEAMNFAGVFDTPTVFFCNNNQWAISVPRGAQTASATLAQKADAYGFAGVQVDGMDPLASYVVTAAAREKALEPGDEQLRPTLIEAIQYRYGAHTTADDPSAYRDDDEVEQWRERDPIDRFEAYLRNRDLLTDDRIESIDEEIETTLEDLLEQAEGAHADPRELFEYTYETPTPRLEEQRAELERLRETHGDEELLEDE
ncbi:pyruvate dehydrogenase (acetyl-transferring) E1 component subunit alpha [Natronorubrum daqingense]|uniref:Pyruvate dehydrogenase (Acetyl-transferring) E1 component subunit alpha n=1 Tax=Natronorubrum daqingense TaxID=588898 RepID=A0A1N7CJ21_9EURY|nr:pyruvate dehydrogenase (acetyl-transferring) E1 component subunit alpha [Natronorubrum daqingense]APX98206.1 pyruvate dehydrogenase (acetyl-transferring) E1 component subunit alpha [Natronorubrum daqingense]SIR63477.1 pyruvate dehydrogenase E1 component alpha subunit [Natronorubrum daqingense]